MKGVDPKGIRTHSQNSPKIYTSTFSKSKSLPANLSCAIDTKFKGELNSLIEKSSRLNLDKTPCLILSSTSHSHSIEISPRFRIVYQESLNKPLTGGGSGARLEKKIEYLILDKEGINSLKGINKQIATIKAEEQKSAQDQHAMLEELKQQKQALLTASFVRKTFPLTPKNINEAKSNHEMRNNNTNSIINNRVEKEIKVIKYGVIINLNNISTRSEKKDALIKAHLETFYKTNNIDQLNSNLKTVYPQLNTTADIELFYDMQWCNSGNVGSQLLHSKKTNILIENLANKVKEIITIRVQNASKIKEENKIQSYKDPFGNKLETRISHDTLKILLDINKHFSTDKDKDKYTYKCNQLYNTYTKAGKNLLRLIDKHKEILYPEAESIQVHDDMNLGNLMGHLDNNELIYIDNGASTTKKSPINSEMIKLLFAFGHQGNLDGSYYLDLDFNTSSSVKKIMETMLENKKIFIDKIEKSDNLYSEISPNFLIQSEFFAIAQHISDGGYTIRGQIQDIITQLETLPKTEDIEKKVELENKLKRLINRCIINHILYEKQIEPFLLKLDSRKPESP
jgi:hypothetical protein